MGTIRTTTGAVNSLLSKHAADYANGVLAVFGGASQPNSAELAEAGTLLLLFTVDGEEFTPGQATNGLNFGTPVNGVVDKSSTETWRGTVLAAASTGTPATYARFYDNSYTTGASTTAKRFDMPILSVSGGYGLYMSDTTLVAGQIREVDAFPVNIPLFVTG